LLVKILKIVPFFKCVIRLIFFVLEYVFPTNQANIFIHRIWSKQANVLRHFIENKFLGNFNEIRSYTTMC